MRGDRRARVSVAQNHAATRQSGDRERISADGVRDGEALPGQSAQRIYRRAALCECPRAMKLRTILTGMLAAATAVSAAVPAEAITIARVTRRGYIVVDEPEAAVPYEGRVPTENTQDTFQFIGELSRLIADTPGAPRGKYLAVMQTSNDASGALAFYLGLVNDVRGIGQTSPIRRNQETYDLNDIAGTAYPITGFVWLNNYQLYINGFADFGKYLICTQEFGHRWGTFTRVPPQPTGNGLVSMGDAGADAGDADTSDASDDAAMDASEGGASDSGVPSGPDLTVNQLLGRQTAHWSYFVHTGGSPMEGNNWNEIMPGVFRTERPTFKFHPMDLYIMGIMAPERVTPVYLIAEPDTMGQTDMNRQRITPSSSPEYSGRTVTIRGRRVNVGIEDIIRANGPRVPAAVDEQQLRDADGGLPMGPDGGFPEPRVNDMEVVWVLLTTSDRVGDRMARDFDRAIDECSDGYSYATDGRSILIPRVAPIPTRPDASVPDASADASTEDSATSADGGAEAGVTNFTLGGGCACRATARAHSGNGRDALGVCASIAALACASVLRRKRRSRTA